ncbi:MAG: 23S rRNA (uracil(1939)-C(5))-methyltransferase RlmD [Clostridia bacterium]|nr:23S rRNA (uracil(1939)-C(5))-methyltransferase RlmD [Clostridia bacterium]
MPEVRKNDEITLDITDLNNLGCGVGRYGGAVVFVRGAVTGDRVKAKIIKVNKSYYVARLIEVTAPSPYRLTEGVCEAPESCGGCVYRHISYEYELTLKRELVKNAFHRAGLDDVEIAEVESVGETRGYRNKAQFPVTRGRDGKLQAGIYASKTHDIVGGSDCMLQPEIFADIAETVCAFCDANGIDAYDELTGRGLLRHIYLRRAEATGQIMVCLVINGKSIPAADRLCAELTNRFEHIHGVLLNINQKNTNVVLGERFITLWGEDTIEDILCGLRIKIAPAAFYQVNRRGAELLYGLAAGRAGKNKDGTLLDLYCGAGTIGLSMARNFGRVVGIEIVPSAVECAKDNAARNGIENAYFSCGDASDAGGLLARAERETGERIDADVVILDPPRKGTTPELIDYISERDIKKVVYVSCDPVTLARDCALFAEKGYSIGTVTPVDMFPRCGHVESVVSLTRGFDVDMRR